MKTSIKIKYIGQAVIFRRLGELDIGVCISSRGDTLKISSCTKQGEVYAINDEPLLLTTLEKTYDFLRGKEMPCKELIDHVELIKHKSALNYSNEIIASIYDIADNAVDIGPPEEADPFLKQILDLINDSRDRRYVRNDQPF